MKKKNLTTVILHGVIFSIIACTIIFILQYFQDNLPSFLAGVINYLTEWGFLSYIIPITIIAVYSVICIGLNNLDTNEIIKKDDVTDEWLLEDFKDAEKAPFNYRISNRYIYIINFNGIYVMRKSEVKKVDIQKTHHTKSREVRVNGYTRSTYHSKDYYIYKIIIRAEKKTYYHKTSDAETAHKLQEYFISNFSE